MTQQQKQQNYRLVWSEDEIRRFYELLIEPSVNTQNQSFIIIPIARRKYWEPLSVSQMTLNSKPIYTYQLTFKQFLNTLLKYQVAEGLYLDKDEKQIPTEAIAMYITANPMNEIKTMFQMITDFNQVLQKHLTTTNNKDVEDSKDNNEPSQQMFEWEGMNRYKSTLHQNAHVNVIKIDVDTKDPTLIQKLDQLLDEESITPMKVETRGGYHYLINRVDQSEKLWKFAKTKENSSWMTMEKNGLIAIPGTIQGGYNVKFVEK